MCLLSSLLASIWVFGSADTQGRPRSCTHAQEKEPPSPPLSFRTMQSQDPMDNIRSAMDHADKNPSKVVSYSWYLVLVSILYIRLHSSVVYFRRDDGLPTPRYMLRAGKEGGCLMLRLLTELARPALVSGRGQESERRQDLLCPLVYMPTCIHRCGKLICVLHGERSPYPLQCPSPTNRASSRNYPGNGCVDQCSNCGVPMGGLGVRVVWVAAHTQTGEG